MFRRPHPGGNGVQHIGRQSENGNPGRDHFSGAASGRDSSLQEEQQGIRKRKKRCEAVKIGVEYPYSHSLFMIASRIAEILVFTKRMNYRRIFHDDQVSFGEIQVYPLAKRYLDEPKRLEDIWVYDEGFVKAMIHMEGEQICELYVYSFFEGEGIVGNLI